MMTAGAHQNLGTVKYGKLSEWFKVRLSKSLVGDEPT